MLKQYRYNANSKRRRNPNKRTSDAYNRQSARTAMGAPTLPRALLLCCFFKLFNPLPLLPLYSDLNRYFFRSYKFSYSPVPLRDNIIYLCVSFNFVILTSHYAVIEHSFFHVALRLFKLFSIYNSKRRDRK